jgi:hypothetical protein
MKNLIDLKQFQNRKHRTNEAVQSVDDVYRVRKHIDIQKSLVNQFKKKVQDESGKKIGEFYADVELAEYMADYIINNYVTIENLPVNLILGDNYSKSQGGEEPMPDEEGQLQPQGQPQGQPQAQPAPQPQGQPQGQPAPQGQSQMPAQGAQQTAAQIPPKEI